MKSSGESSFRYGWIKNPNVGDVPIPYWISLFGTILYYAVHHLWM